jgi:hypothetical protein
MDTPKYQVAAYKRLLKKKNMMDCLDLVKVHSSFLWPRDDALASIKQYIDANSIEVSVTN